MRQTKHSGGAHAPKKRGRTAALIIGIILLLAAAGVIAYSIWERPPELPQVTKAPTTTTAPRPTEVPVETEPPVGEGSPEVTPEPDIVEADALVTDRAPGTYTFLLVGRDHASNSTDTIIVGRMDTKAHTIDCISIPRDTLINISWSSTPKKINAVYPGYINSGKDGIEGLKTHIKNLLGFDVDCYAVVSIRAVEQAVDTLGGVWFDVPTDMHYDDPLQNLSIHIPAGYQLLDGENAVKVCRFRDTYAGGDIDRIGVQQSFLKALASQVLSVGNIPNMGALVDILVENLETDLSAANIAWFARQFLLCDSDNVNFKTMPWSTGCMINGTSYVSIDLNAWLSMVNECLNPYLEPVTAANVNILTSNYSGTSMQSTTGVVAGGEDSFFCLSCTVAAGGTSQHHLPGMCPNG